MVDFYNSRAALLVCRLVSVWVFLIGNADYLHAQSRGATGVAYYDIDHLYDTIPALFYNDEDYTPNGRLKWNTERYWRKVRKIASVIDSMALPIVALRGVENKAVVRDIVRSCRGDYSYLHETLNTLDGMEFALLYYGDWFFPFRVETGARCLQIEGVLQRDTVALVLSADSRSVRWFVEDLRREQPRRKIILLGRMGDLDPMEYGLCDGLKRVAKLGRGNVWRRGGWIMRDRIWIDSTLRLCGGDVYARKWMFDPLTNAPQPTYDGRRYRGGCSYALPIFVYVK